MGDQCEICIYLKNKNLDDKGFKILVLILNLEKGSSWKQNY